MAQEQRNSFEDLPAWATTELMQIEALVQAVNETNKCDTRKNAAQVKIDDYRSMIDKIDTGGFSWKMMFKGQQAK